MISVLITLTTAGEDTGPFDLYTNLDGYVTPFETSIAKASLEAGYISTIVPLGTTTVRVYSVNPTCLNYIDLGIDITPTTTTTSTTLAPPLPLGNFYAAWLQICIGDNCGDFGEMVVVQTIDPITEIGLYSDGATPTIYRINGSLSGPADYVYSNTAISVGSGACCI